MGASLIALTPAVSNNVAADLHRSAAAAQQRAVQLLSTDDPGVVNPIQTWINVFTDSAANLQADYAMATTYGPFPVLEQELANQAFIDGTQVIPAFQNSALAGVQLYTEGPNSGVPGTIAGFWGTLFEGLSQVGAGDFQQGFETIADAGIPALASSAGLELANLLPVLPDELDTLPTAVTFLLSDVYLHFAIQYWINWPLALGWEFGTDVQNAYDGFASGDLLAGVTNLLNIPGAFTGQFLNGGNGGLDLGNAFYPGFLTPGTPGPGGGNGMGLLSFFTTWASQGTANALVYPGAPNIVEGGNFAGAVQQFLAQVSNFTPNLYNSLAGIPTSLSGWPTPAIIVNNVVNLFQDYVGVGGLSAAATGASAADVAGIAPSIAANVAGLAPSIAADLATRLPAELGTLAANILTSLF
ncbi:hypothetical protein K3U93_23815 [Mycobacterium malmoense]|uniref:PE-PGRS family protein n=1 Tax=Mycobacterium malmoense TaxID=1780 RepID=A0ABX3SMT4_MYCMA|nr:hypothetical protein [Mycobacterium malmoense]ORA78600.1 hypothetical protein BST29_20845 [Mycobacterium malmoense]QZA17547.1 hypothetical protein K3U93_23815 [Mycobacterium malmoense]UNB94331.1 hypothetical protein H5T25_23795 [Mycobacterium malmoense]